MKELRMTGWLALLLLCLTESAFPAPRPFSFRTPAPLALVADDATMLEAVRAGQTGWLNAKPDAESSNYFLLGSRVVLQLRNTNDLPALLAAHHLQSVRRVAPGVYILQAPDAWAAALAAHRLAGTPGVLASYPIFRRHGGVHGPYYPRPTETNFLTQWYLEDRYLTGLYAGPDLDARAAWPATLGQGVTVAVVDTGVELTHQELSNNVTAGPHTNFVNLTASGLPMARTATVAHGTEVAGLIGASINTFRMTGVAPMAQLASWVIFDQNLDIAADDQLMAMYEFASNTVPIQNHSWGLDETQVTQGGPSLLEQIGISNAITYGRNGLGAIMVRSAGNGRTDSIDADDSLYASDPRFIGVAAIRFDGRAASYSSPGASILLSAPSGDPNAGFAGLFTTDLIGTDGVNAIGFLPPNADLNDYVFGTSFGFAGTSSSAPLVSGVAALMLSANPNLTYRDVQQILLLSARQYDFSDPDLVTNGAGFLVSHNQGFGLPDAGVAVALARTWSNRPPATNLVFSSSVPAAIPPDGLHVLVSGPAVHQPPIECVTDSGPQVETATALLPLVNCGVVSGPIGLNLTNKGALVGRGGTSFSNAITLAAQAGAAFAVVYNYAENTNDSTSGDAIFPMASTDFVPIPAVFIGNTDGLSLSNLFQTNLSAVAQINLQSTNYTFTVTNTLVCEHVGLTVNANNPDRGQLRITLVSPMGTRSVLQKYNADTSPGPTNWTYWTTHDFFESSAGTWTAYISDEGQFDTGTVENVSLSISGVPIVDSDHDGLDDRWEMKYFGNLSHGPQEDPDHDGYNNAREQLMGTSPIVNNNLPFLADFSQWNPTNGRLSWPSSLPYTYQIRAGTNPASLSAVTNVAGNFPITEWFLDTTNPPYQFFQVISTPAP